MTQIRRLYGCTSIGLGLMLTATASSAVNDPGDFQAPAVPALGPETIQVVARPGGGADVILLNGPGSGDDVVLDGGGFPLIVALKNAVPGSDPVIGIYGRISQGGNG
ncbi:MAG: hypothetical protein IID28_09665, partial [Planctomycetes bacterium]|nr:hypothetical protein [Planctomycetota bacterium]